MRETLRLPHAGIFLGRIEMMTDSNITRRSFISGGAALAVTASSVVGAPRAAERRLRMALVGTGARGSFTWGQEVVQGYSDVVEIVGLCDINSKRVEAAKKLIGTTAPSFVDFDRMIKETHPDTVMVTTVDATHARYIVRALELRCDVMTEKPLCTDEEQCVSILDAQKKSGKKVIVAFNARHDPEAEKIKGLLMEKAVGDVISVDFHEYLDTSHGADYFRRWHRLKQNSGTLLVHKASHHFDLANWWLDSTPVVVKYENGVFLNYTANTYLPFEGQAISINGRTGRLDYNEFGGGGFGNKGLRLTRSFGKSEVIQDLEARRAGGHGGADTSLHDLIFRGSQGSDPLGLRADLRAGARSSLIGIAAYRSIERGGQTIRIKDLVKL